MFTVPFSLSENAWRAVWITLGLIVLLGAVLFGIDKCSSYWSQRGVDKKKAAANVKLDEIQHVDEQIANLKEQRAEKVGEAKVLVEDVKQAEVEEKKAEANTNAAVNRTDQALKNLNAAGTSNVDVTGAQLEEKLRRLRDR